MGKSVQEWLQDPELFTTCAMGLVFDKFGTEVLKWDPATIVLEIERTFNIEVDHRLMDKVNAGITLFDSNLFFISPEVFSPVCNILNFGAMLGGMSIPASLDDILWGCTEARILLGDIYVKESFGHGPARYTGALLASAGIQQPPPILSFAELPETYIEDIEYTEDDLLEMVRKQDADLEEMERENVKRMYRMLDQLTKLPIKMDDMFLEAVRTQVRQMEPLLDFPQTD